MADVAITAGLSAELRRHAKASPILPTKEQLALESQHVTVRNNDPRQTHIVLDRYLRGHSLKPGEHKEIEMTKPDIEFFVKSRDPNRTNEYGEKQPLHPISIDGIKLPETEQSARQQSSQNQNRNR